MRRTRALLLIPVLLAVVTITFSVLRQDALSGSVREQVDEEGLDRLPSFRALQGGGGGHGGGGGGGGVLDLIELIYDVITLGCYLGKLIGIGCFLGIMLCCCLLLVVCATANDPGSKASLVNAPGVRNNGVAQRVPRTSTRQKRTSKSVRMLNLAWVHEGQDNEGGGAGLPSNTKSGEGLLANSGTAAADAAVYPDIPSGQWRGYYFQYGRQHSLFEFNLQFVPGHPLPTVRGFGADEVGEYTIRSGSFNLANGRVCFTKKYRAGTGDRHENFGHSVEYRGTFAGSLAAGLRGSWFVATSRYTGEGTFHLWPSLYTVSPSAPMAIAVAIPAAQAVAVPSAPAATDLDLGNEVASAPSLAEVQANMGEINAPVSWHSQRLAPPIFILGRMFTH